MKVKYIVLKNIYGEFGELEGQEPVEKEIEVADEIIHPIIDYLAEIGKENRLREVIINGCRTVEQAKQYINDLVNEKFY